MDAINKSSITNFELTFQFYKEELLPAIRVMFSSQVLGMKPHESTSWRSSSNRSISKRQKIY